MRQIEFRGKRIKDGKWIFGNLADYSMKVFNTTIEKKIIFGNILNFSTDNFGFVVDDCAVDPDTIGQFSELFDRTGKNIFEGDILQCSSVPNILLEVRYNTLQGAFCLVEHTHTEGALLGTCPLGEMLRHYPDMSIIGNRFDNPSLISDKQ